MGKTARAHDPAGGGIGKMYPVQLRRARAQGRALGRPGGPAVAAPQERAAAARGPAVLGIGEMDGAEEVGGARGDGLPWVALGI